MNHIVIHRTNQGYQLADLVGFLAIMIQESIVPVQYVTISKEKRMVTHYDNRTLIPFVIDGVQHQALFAFLSSDSDHSVIHSVFSLEDGSYISIFYLDGDQSAVIRMDPANIVASCC